MPRCRTAPTRFARVGRRSHFPAGRAARRRGGRGQASGSGRDRLLPRAMNASSSARCSAASSGWANSSAVSEPATCQAPPWQTPSLVLLFSASSSGEAVPTRRTGTAGDRRGLDQPNVAAASSVPAGSPRRGSRSSHVVGLRARHRQSVLQSPGGGDPSGDPCVGRMPSLA